VQCLAARVLITSAEFVLLEHVVLSVLGSVTSEIAGEGRSGHEGPVG
jgi:hypothetical protein